MSVLVNIFMRNFGKKLSLNGSEYNSKQLNGTSTFTLIRDGKEGLNPLY